MMVVVVVIDDGVRTLRWNEMEWDGMTDIV